MFITRTEKTLKTFFLDDNRDLQEYERIINDPGINILDRVFYTQSEKEFEGEAMVVTERPCVRMEYEVCSL